MKCKERGSRDEIFLFFMCAMEFQIYVTYCMMHLHDCFNKLHGRFHNSFHTKQFFKKKIGFIVFLGCYFFHKCCFLDELGLVVKYSRRWIQWYLI